MRTYKRIAAVALGVTFAVLAFAAPAVATWADSTYLDWNQVKSLGANPSNPNSTSPHGGYSSTSVKCGVCHAVHNARLGGQALLHDTIANACSYCHISGGTAGKTVVYGGSSANYLLDTPYNHSAEHGAPCGNCHQVHASTNDMTLHWYLSQKILIGPKYQDFEAPQAPYDSDIATAPNELAPGVTDTPEQALTKWCTVCHQGAYSYYSSNVWDNDTHVLADADGQSSYSGSRFCSSCHSSERNTTGAWPHMTEGARFLESAATSVGGAVSTTKTVGETSVDGVCLKCHRNGSGSGVGLSF